MLRRANSNLNIGIAIGCMNLQLIMEKIQTLLEAKELGLKRFRKSPFCNVSLKVEPNQIVAISGEHGSGKSALLLTLSGYMKFTSGSLKIADIDLPHHLMRSRNYVGLGLFAGINDFYKTQTIEEALISELKLASKSPIFREQYKNNIEDCIALKQYACDVLTYWKVLSPLNTQVGELTPCELMRLGIALALLKKPFLLFVDNIESELTSEQSDSLIKDIRSYVSQNYCSCLVSVLQSELEKQADQIISLSNVKANSVNNRNLLNEGGNDAR